MDSLFPNLRATMKQRGVSIKMLADVIGRSEEIVYLKLRGVREWTLKEALEIARYLQHPDLKTLFIRQL